MISFLKGWITSVLVTVVFLVIVDTILPSNNMKKYAKFVMGLIIIITLLTPVFKIFNAGGNIEDYIAKYTKELDVTKTTINKNEIQKDVNKKTIEAFKKKLKTAIEQSIFDKTGKKYVISQLDIVEDIKEKDFSKIKYIELKKGSNNGDIKEVDKIIIGENQNKEEECRDKGVLNLLEKEFNINSSLVKFIK